MIFHLAVLLSFQLMGEVVSRSLGLFVPGPVLGMAFLLVAFLIFPKLAQSVRDTAQGILAHLSLLFVPAGVGVIGHIDRFGTDGLPILIAIVASTVLAIIVGVLVFVGVAKLTGAKDA